MPVQLCTRLQGLACDMIALFLLPGLDAPSLLEASPCPFVLWLQ